MLVVVIWEPGLPAEQAAADARKLGRTAEGQHASDSVPSKGCPIRQA